MDYKLWLFLALVVIAVGVFIYWIATSEARHMRWALRTHRASSEFGSAIAPGYSTVADRQTEKTIQAALIVSTTSSDNTYSAVGCNDTAGDSGNSTCVAE